MPNKAQKYTHTQRLSFFCVDQLLLGMGPVLECGGYIAYVCFDFSFCIFVVFFVVVVAVLRDREHTVGRVGKLFHYTKR